MSTWNKDRTAELVAAYNEGNGKSVAELAKQFETSIPSVRSKLVSEGVYVKQEPRAVGGASPTRKINLVRTLETALGASKNTLTSLEKAKKEELETLLEMVQERRAAELAQNG